MAKEYLIQGDTLTNIADKIRVLSGTEGALKLDDMAVTLETSNTNLDNELNTQSGLIDQIQTALEGKASGGGSGGIETANVTFINTNEDYDYEIAGTWPSNDLDTLIDSYPITLWADETVTKVAIIGSFLSIPKNAFGSASGNYVNHGWATGSYCIAIKGDCTITLQ